MADKEGGRTDAQFLVISTTPDVCKSPLVPVPYPIIGYMNQSIKFSPNVRARGKFMFHMGSRVATVVGDEAGVGGGVMSQVFKGMCRPITPVPTVRINGQFHTHHQNTLMFMNCAGPEGPFNTIGTVKFVGLMIQANVGPGGSVPAGTDPPISPESFAEGGCLPDVQKLPGFDIGDLVGYAQTAYSLATTDWSNPASVLGAIGGVSSMAGLGGLTQAANLASKGISLMTADWSNPGAALGSAMGIGGALLGGGVPANSPPPGTVPVGGCF